MNRAVLVDYIVTAVIIFKNLLVYAIIARILLSWFTMGQMGGGGRFSRFLQDVTDPVINLIRIIPHKIGMIDLAPMIAIFVIDLLGEIIVMLIYKFI